jgi:hypothetical protein
MARITRAAAHLSAEEVKRHMKTAKTALYRQRWLIVYTCTGYLAHLFAKLPTLLSLSIHFF